jgi:hypothetical protein
MWSARWRWFSAMAVLFVGAAASSDALGYGQDSRSPAVKMLVSCLEKAYSDGAYLSTDGGRSAKRLLSKCASEGDAVSKECFGTSDTSQNCHSKTVALVQEFILQQERELK